MNESDLIDIAAVVQGETDYGTASARSATHEQAWTFGHLQPVSTSVHEKCLLLDQALNVGTSFFWTLGQVPTHQIRRLFAQAIPKRTET